MSSTTQLTTLGHSCVLIERYADDGACIRVLLDPGNLTPPLQPISDLDAVLVTHSHADHIDAEQVKRLRTAGSVPVFGDQATVALLESAGVGSGEIIAIGHTDIQGLTVEVSAGQHEEIYSGVPVPVNLGFHIGGEVFAPGDAFTVPDFPVDVLLIPTGAPWMKLSETIDYLRAVAPRIAIPIHDGGLALPHREMHRTLLQKFAPDGCTVLRPETGQEIDLGAL